jgi:radical SAM superfamily enzyme YgiQ (UPF0313 family)
MKSFGVYKIARELRIAGYEVAVIHHLHVFSYDEICLILKKLISDQTVFVGFNNTFYRPIDDGGSVHIYNQDLAGSFIPHGKEYNLQLKELIYSLNSNCKIVLGGPTADDKDYNKDYDYVVIGYADKSVINLADHLAYNKPLNNYSTGTFVKNIINDPVAKGFDFPNRKMEYKDYDCLMPGETLFLEVARGCIFKCSFCSFPLNGKKKLDFIKHKEIIVEELIENYKKYGITKYLLLDDTFNDSIEKIQLIYEVSQEVPFDFEFWAYIRLDLLSAHPETIDTLIKAGLKGCQFGIETLHPKSAKSVGKGQDPKKQIETLRYIKRTYGDKIFLHASFIAGLPYEPVQSMIDTYEFFLDEKHNLLDSVEVHPMGIEDYRGSKKTFRSKISSNPEQYGQEIITTDTHGAYYTNWKNEHLHFNDALKIATKYRKRFATEMNKITPQDIFFLLSLGYEWKDFEHVRYNEFNWDDAKQRKLSRAQEYKMHLNKYFGIGL